MTGHRPHPTGILVALEVFVAAGAWAGAAAFATGGLDTLAVDLPWRGHLVGAAGLAFCIALPSTIAAIALAQGRSWSPRLAMGTAVVLATWVLGQTLFVGLSALQPAYLLVAGFIGGLAVELQRNMAVPPELVASVTHHVGAAA
jgi:hypothetical protein